jgi:hypothetical protein
MLTRCTRHNLSDKERLEYIRAVKCLFELPGRGMEYSGAVKNRHDDFSSVHIYRTGEPDPAGNSTIHICTI